MKSRITPFVFFLALIFSASAFAQESSSLPNDTEQTSDQKEVEEASTETMLPADDKADKKKKKKETDPEKEAEKARKEARKNEKKGEKEEEKRLKEEELARERQYYRNSPKMLKMAGKQPN